MRGFLGRVSEFLNDVKGELKKVSYPTRSETMGSTTVVIVLVLIIGVFLSLLDMVLVKAVRLIIQ
ncbi:MAG: preprotein translocase subunit SecE [Nitrospirae bacterium]|nr:preprotein translocase subunit SecE [Nitrospirota bacterium]